MKCLHETVYLRVVTDSWQTGDTSGVSPSSLKLIGTRNRLIKVRRLIAFFFWRDRVETGSWCMDGDNINRDLMALLGSLYSLGGEGTSNR